MHEISPVLAGTFDASGYQAASVNYNPATTGATGATDTAAATPAVDTTNSTSSNYIDPRRYSKFDRSASQVADAPDFSFGDFLDMVNPLQHIPVISSVYRAATGNTINPVARVAGDIMYGGAIGAVSAVIGGTSAIADAVSESQNGHDKTGAVLSSLFGDDKAQTTQLAATNGATTSVATATQAAPKTDDQNLVVASTALPGVAPAPLTAASATSGAAPAAPTVAATPAASPLMQAKAFPLNKAAYGGVMAPGNSMEDQNRIIALSQSSHAMRLGNTIYTSRLMNGPHPLPVASPPATTDGTATASASTSPANTANITPASGADQTASSTSTSANQTAAAAAASTPAGTASSTIAATGRNALPQNLVDDMMMMKALSQYQNTAAGPVSLGANLDMKN